MRKFRFIGISVLLVVFLVGCAPLSKVYKNATEEERVKLWLAESQANLDSMVTLTEAYLAIHPEKKNDVKTLVAPMMKKANEAIRDATKTAKESQGKITVAQVMRTVYPKIIEIENILIQWGISRK